MRCATVFSALGALGGSSLGKARDGDSLIFLFGVLMMVVGALMLKPRKAVTVECRPVDLRIALPPPPWHSPPALHPASSASAGAS
ncbi:putative membrane protein YfcA [Rhizobium ruizarguesonis]